MEVEYSLALEDVLAFTFNQAQRSPKKAKGLGLSHWLLMSFILTGIASNSAKDPLYHVILTDAALFLFGAWAGGMLAALRYLRIIRRSEEEYSKDLRNRFLFGPRRFSISAEGITIISEGFQSYRPWQGIVGFAVSKGHVFFYTGSIAAEVVPKRAFRDDQHFKEFVELAQRFHNGSASKG